MPAIRAPLLALVAVALGASSLRAQDVVCEGGEKEVRDLDFRGNSALSDAELALRVTTTPSDFFVRHLRLTWLGGTKRCVNLNQLPRDVGNLRIYYRLRGFYGARVDTATRPIDDDGIGVIFNIVEGPPTILAQYRVRGLSGVRDSADIMRNLQLKVGERFDQFLYAADRDAIVARLRNAGHFRAIASTAFDRFDTTLTAFAEIDVQPGPIARFGEPTIEVTPVDSALGQQISNETVKRLIGISPGQLYSDRAITQAQRSLFQLAAYRNVDISPLPDSAQPAGDTIVLLSVRLTEDYMRNLDSEFGWATLDCGRIRLQYTDRNAFKQARRLELTGQVTKLGYGHPLRIDATKQLCDASLFRPRRPLAIAEDPFSDTLQYSVTASLRQPRLLGTRFIPTTSIYSERRGEYKAYLRRTLIGADVSASRDFGEHTPTRIGYSIEYGSTTAEAPALCALFNLCDAESRSFLTDKNALGVASLSAAHLHTNNFVSPTSGFTLRGEVRTSALSPRAKGDSAYFNKGTGDIAFYRPLGNTVLAFRLRGGLVLGQRLRFSDETSFIPPQERLFAGGPTSVRGFQQNELGAAVYIANPTQVRTDVIPPSGTSTDTLFQFQLQPNVRRNAIDTTQLDTLGFPNPGRTVPLGGNALLVANLELRTRLPFLLPEVLQFTAFLDAGDVWSKRDSLDIKMTPGLGIRALTPVGPVQVNIGYNDHPRPSGQLFHNPNVNTLVCATPGNTLQYRRENGVLVEQTQGVCPGYKPPERQRFLQRLTFTFSISSDF